MTLLALLGVAFLSALIPLINLEAYLGAVALLSDPGDWWDVAGLAAVAATGQMAGKMLFYLAGRGVLTLPRRLRPDPDRPLSPRRQRAAARIEGWRERVGRQPWLGAVFVAVSASTGLPPFALVALAAGALRIPWVVFVVTGLVGRWVRFAAVLGLVEIIAA